MRPFLLPRRGQPHVTLNPTDLAAACLQAAADDPGAQARYFGMHWSVTRNCLVVTVTVCMA
jgi:hypothetical protein